MGPSNNAGTTTAPPLVPQQEQQQQQQPAVFSRQRVFSAVLVHGKPFYGYHSDDKIWIKLMFYDPRDVARAASLLQSGAILSRRWQPHESHIPYLLQLKIDLNLQGMGFLTLETARFRLPLPTVFPTDRHGWRLLRLPSACDIAALSPLPKDASVPVSSPTDVASHYVWTENSTPVSMQWGAYRRQPLMRQSTCDIEVDGSVDDVKNRAKLVRVPLSEARHDMRLVDSLAPIWEDEERRCEGPIPVSTPEAPRTPQSLGSSHGALRAKFKAVETALIGEAQQQQQQQKCETYCTDNGDGDGDTMARKPSVSKPPQRWMHPANEDITQTSGQMVPFAEGDSILNGEEAIRHKEYARFVDQGIVATQGVVEVRASWHETPYTYILSLSLYIYTLKKLAPFVLLLSTP